MQGYIMENQTKLNEERLPLLGMFKELAPEFVAAEFKVLDLIYESGALSTKVKRLISLAIALRAGCTNCVLGQCQLALKAGANKDEVMETLFVVTAMSGTTGIAESLRVIKFMVSFREGCGG
jgi:AhpD family alkylhydroperoxidase